MRSARSEETASGGGDGEEEDESAAGRELVFSSRVRHRAHMAQMRLPCGALLACACAIAAAKKVAVNADATSKPLPTPHRQFTTRIETTAHQLNATDDCTPRAAAASALCVPRRPARPVPILTSLASDRGRPAV